MGTQIRMATRTKFQMLPLVHELCPKLQTKTFQQFCACAHTFRCIQSLKQIYSITVNNLYRTVLNAFPILLFNLCYNYFKFHSSIFYRYLCDHGYILQGTDEAICNDGTLDPNPLTHPPRCRIIDCPSITAPQFGTITRNPNRPPVHGSIISFSCDSTHFLTGPNRKTCDAGMWHPSGMPTCNPKPCNSYPCQNDGVCENRGNHDYHCECGTNWHGQSCSSRTVIVESLKREIEDSLRQNGGTNNHRYAHLLYRYLKQRYDDYYWVVNSYNPVWTFEKHIVGACDTCAVVYFRNDDHPHRNLVVSWARLSSSGRPNHMHATKAAFRRGLERMTCDPKSIYGLAEQKARELNLHIRMMHVVRSQDGIYSKIDDEYAFTLAYHCNSGGERRSITIAFGHG